ncbi:helix-turn-helix domain-containing protein [Streptomyces sp. NPDC001339]|uniref:helix-turn-helix domain-containing protein n=1 Tax=Streptomyces sp. NPDC001339 TaxID=3364563 RepID=UPI00369D5E99
MAGTRETRSGTMRMFGGQLKGWRQRVGVSREELADAAGYGVDLICAVEQGRRAPSPKLIDAAEEVCDAGGLLREAAKYIVRRKYPDWFEDYRKYEEQAAQLGMYENHVIPGLFQTPEYAREVFRNDRPVLGDEEIERRVAARLERQELLRRTPAVAISAVLEQVTLEREIGGREVIRHQVEHLLELTRMRNVDIQVMPTKRETHAGLAGPVYVIETQDQQRMVYCEAHKGSALISDSKDVADLNLRYAMLRSQALNLEESVSLLEKMLGELQ